jgi:hypothetical protein
MGWRFASVAWLCIAGSLAGCVVYDPALVHRGDAGNGACNPHHPPPRPSGTDGMMAGDVSFGLRDVVLAQSTGMAWRMIGFDLDDLCTDSTHPAAECTTAVVELDGVDGIDNQFGAELYPLVNVAVPGLEMHAREAQTAGNGLPVLRMRGWNGTMNDPLVDITITTAVFSTTGTNTTMAPTLMSTDAMHPTLANGMPLPAPAWDGQDWTWVRDDSFVAGNVDMPLVRDDQAYVTNGMIVARIPSRVDIIFPTSTVGVLVRLTDAVAVGQLSADGMMLNNVVVAGRWSITDLLSTAQNIGLCAGTSEYNILVSELARFADVRSQPPMPGDPVLMCDALSLGVGFTGFRMRIAGTASGLPILDQCTMDGGVPDGSTPTDAGATDVGVADTGVADTGAMDAGVDADIHDAGSDAGSNG